MPVCSKVFRREHEKCRKENITDFVQTYCEHGLIVPLHILIPDLFPFTELCPFVFGKVNANVFKLVCNLEM